jgi:peptide/nickel transport system substrate-binding protein
VRVSLPSSVSLGLAALLALSGCGFSGSEGEAQGADLDQKIVVDNFRAPVADWALESDASYILSLSGCLETLTRYDEAEGQIVPSLATEWEQVSEREWDFTIRDGVRFQDGTDLTVEAVVASLQHVLDAVDPFGHCTGPFTAVSEQTKQSLTLERNEDYWGGQVQLAGAEVRFITDGATRAAQVQTGEADVSLSIPVSSLSTLESDGNVEVLKADSPRTATLYMNNGKKPFDDVDFRKAITAAIDLDALAASVYEGAAIPATGPFAPSEPWAIEGADAPKQDLDAARDLLSAAGYTAGRPLEVIAIVERAEFADVATVIQENLKAVGVPVKIRTVEYAAVEPDLLAGNYAWCSASATA